LQTFSAVLFCAAALDLLLGDRFGLGSALRQGLNAIIELLLLMTGFMALTPWIAAHLVPLIRPFFLLLGCDPSLFAGLFLSCDAGGAVLAAQTALDPQAGLYNGLIVASFCGCALTSAVPLSLVHTQGAKQSAAVRGLSVAFVLMPFGCLLTGAFCGFSLPIMLRNTGPVLLVAALLLAGLRLWPQGMVPLFSGLSAVIRGIALFGFCAAVCQEAGIPLPIEGLTPLDEIYPVICRIGVFLGGILPFFTLLQRALRRPLQKLAQRLRISSESVSYLLLTTANGIPALLALDTLDETGVMLNVAFSVLSAYTVGDFLAFSLQFAPRLAVPMLLGRLLSGVSVLAVCLLFPHRKAQ